MSYSKIFLYSCLFFILGVFVNSVWDFNFWTISVLIIIPAILFALHKANKYFLVLGIWLICLALGMWRFQLSWPKQTAGRISYYNGSEIEFSGIVAGEPDLRADKIRLTIQTQKIFINDRPQKIYGKVLVTDYLYPGYDYGDKLKIFCALQKPEKIEDFAYDNYLALSDIYSLCYYPKIKLEAKSQGNIFLAKIYQAKNYFIGRLNKVLPEPQSSFLGGLLLGAKRAIPADLQAVFQKTGTTHIIAVSGYNITILVAFLGLCLQSFGLSRKRAFWLILATIVVFVLLTGAQASIVRAGIMGFLVLLANYLGRKSSIKNSLALAAVLMLLANPKILVFDLGFQLSFLATLGLVYLQPVLSKITNIENCKLKIVKLVFGDYLLTTMSAIIMTTPLILYNFGKLSLIAPVANILVLPFIPLAMLLGFIAGIGNLLFLRLGWILGWLVWLVLNYIIWVLEKLAGLNWAYWEFAKINVWLMAGMYLLIVWFIWKMGKTVKKMSFKA